MQKTTKQIQSSNLAGLSFAEYFGGEGFDGCAFEPCVHRQFSLAASLFQESGAVPAALGGDLRQQEAAAALPADQQTVPADLNFFRSNGLCGSEDAQLNLELRRFFFGDGRKSVVIERRGAGGLGYGAINRARREHITDASSQLLVEIEGSENAASLGQVWGGRVERNLAIWRAAISHCGRNGIMRQVQQLDAFESGEFTGADCRVRIRLRERHRHLPDEAPVAACGG
jgi:hypothetical protein